MAACKNLFYQHEYNYQISKKYSPFKIMNDFNEAFNSFLSHVANNYSVDTAKAFEFHAKMMTNLKLTGKRVNENVRMKDDLDFLQEGVEIYGKKDYQIQDNTKMTNSHLLYKSLFPYDLIDTVQNSCFGVTNGIDTGGDYFNRFTRNLNISAFSCNHPKVGKHVVNHELGHVFGELIDKEVSSEKSKETYLKNRECVSSRSLIPNYQKIKRKYFVNDHFYTEEDMADFISSKMNSNEKELGKSDHFKACSYMPIVNNELGTINLDFQEYDNHSPSFFRLINTLVDRNIKIPAECKDVLEKKSHIYNPIKCE